MTIGGSYTWSHYYGNFDQDNSSFSFANDAAIFIGSSNIGDGPGRQLWNFKYGNLRGDRRNQVKLNATYNLPWRATVGASIAQRAVDDGTATESWAYLFVPQMETSRAWERIIKREPKCVEWSETEVRALVVARGARRGHRRPSPAPLGALAGGPGGGRSRRFLRHCVG